MAAKNSKLTRAEINKLAKKHGLPPLPTKQQYTAKIKREARALPKETRQAVLDMWHGGIKISDIKVQLCLTLDQVLGVIELNTVVHKWTTINKVTV